MIIEQKVDKHEVSGKVVVDGHVFSDAGKSGRSTYGRYSNRQDSFSTISDAKKWVKTQPKKSPEEIDRVHKKHAEFEKSMNEEITNSVGTGGYNGTATATGPVAGFDPIIGKMVRRKVQTFKTYVKKKDGIN